MARRPVVLQVAVFLAVALWFCLNSAQGADLRLSSREFVHPAYKFSIRTLYGWNQTPPNPEEENRDRMVCKWNDPRSEAQKSGPSILEALWGLSIHRFPLEEEARNGETVENPGKIKEEGIQKAYEKILQAQAVKTFQSLLTRLEYLSFPEGTPLSKSGFLDEPKGISTLEKIPGSLWFLENAISKSIHMQKWDEHRKKNFSVSLFAAGLKDEKEEYGILFTCPANRSKRVKSTFLALVKSFKFPEKDRKAYISVDKRELVSEEFKGELPKRAARRLEVKEKHLGNPDWGWVDAENYLVLYNKKFKKGQRTNNNKDLAERIAVELEWMRKQHYTRYLVPIEPIDALGVVRVCRDRAEYMSYGAPPASAGYWSSAADEIVFYDASNSKKLDAQTRMVLFHEGFHQYLTYAMKGESVHIWINEGHADYFGAAELKGGTFYIQENMRRINTAKNAVVTGGCPPIRKLLLMSQADHYSKPDLHYAVGWSLVYYLNEIEKRPEYKDLNRLYFDAFQRGIKEGLTGEVLKKKAYEESFGKVELDKLEALWTEGVKKM